MTVKVVTDSVCDIPQDLAEELGITVIPIYVHFGEESYRDGVDISKEEFFRKLKESPAFPTTSVPSIGEVLEVYEKLAEETDEIASVHLAPPLSAICDVALQAREQLGKGCRVEVIDTRAATAQEGLIVIAAAKLAREGMNLDQLVSEVHCIIPRAHLRVAFDTLEYLAKGGRIGRAQAFMGSLLRVHPILGVKDGEVVPVARERSRARAVNYLYNFVASFNNIRELAVGDAVTPDEAEMLAERLASIYPKERIYRLSVGCVTGAHVGPHALGVALIEGE